MPRYLLGLALGDTSLHEVGFRAAALINLLKRLSLDADALN